MAVSYTHLDVYKRQGWSISEVRNKIIGEENTSVRVSVLRDGEELEFITTRVAVHENSVNSAELKGNIGYIQDVYKRQH